MQIKIIRVIDEPFYYDRGSLKEYITNRKCEVEINGENIGFYGYPLISDIYKAIKEKKKLYYPKCIIEDFALNDYKKKYDINKFDEVKLFDANFTRSIFYLKKNKEIDFYNAIFENHLSFYSTIFCDGNVIFSNCEFTDPKMTDFCRAQFGTGNKYFSATYRSEKINFIRVNFGNGDVKFTETEFYSKKIEFTHSIFGDGLLLFEEIQFEAERIEFDNCTFGKGDIVFTGSDFGDGNIRFNNSKFESEKIYFCSTRFGVGGLDFTNAILPFAAMDFEDAQFGDVDVIFNDMQCKSLIFNNCYLFGDMFFLKTQISEILSLINFRNDGSLYIDFITNHLKDLIYNQKETFFNMSQQFLLLKQNFNKLGHFDDEDFTYVEFKRCQAKAKLDESKKKGFIKNFGGFLIYCGNRFMFDFVGGYGTKPRNVFRFMIFVIFGFAPLFAFIPNFLKWEEITKQFSNIELLNKLLIGLYHSMITFLTIGYGDIQPESVYGSLLSGVEGFIGLFLMAYFTIAFSRKVLR